MFPGDIMPQLLKASIFHGVTLDRRDVVGFANLLAASLGFPLIIKPGPFICAEFHRGESPIG